MTMLTMLKRTTALAALVALPFAPAAVHAESAQVTGTQPPGAADQAQGTAEAQPTQDAAQAGQQTPENVEEKQLPGVSGQPGAGDPVQSGQQTGQQTGQQAETGQQTGQEAQQEAGQQAKAGQDQDALVAKVGDSEIRRSDVLTVIGLLPPQLQQQPPEMLIPIALDQLVMRELILQKAKTAGLESDPAVASLAQDASERAREDAMVQVWLDKELGKAVTEDKVQQTYDTVKQQMGDQAPDVETLRPQIEQELRQQAFLDISRDLQANADITLYGPDGQPVKQSATQ